MAIRIGLCSDIDLESRFKHMTTKKWLEYEEDQLNGFEHLIQTIVNQKIDAFFIAGNLFGSPKPKNRTIEKVVKLFKDLEGKGIECFILPGDRDTPLNFSNDRPVHHIFEDLENVHLLLKEDLQDLRTRTVNKSSFSGAIKNEKLNLFSSPSPFISLDELQLAIEAEENSCNIFVISDVFAFKKDVEAIYKNFLEQLNNTGINYLLIGGNIPQAIKNRGLKFKIIHCPQIHQNNFEYCESNHGLLIETFDKGKFQGSSEFVPISKFDVIYNQINVNQIAITEINRQISENIMNLSDLKKNILRITLLGDLDKSEYHGIEMFKYQKMGHRMNYYFELYDQIEFKESSPDIQGLNPLKELEQFKDNIISEALKNDNLSNSEKKDISSVYEGAMHIIKQEWDK
jgi:DNA repair exonuclease SbcCD nuclease subunit